MNQIPKSTLAGVGLIALSTLLLEVSITRIFAVTLWYYFGFLAISLALLGTAAAGVLCFLRPKRWAGESFERQMSGFALAFGLLTPFVISAHLQLNFGWADLMTPGFFGMLALHLLLFFILFFCAGMVITIALFRYSDRIGKVYFIDLLGASLGSVAVIILLYRVSAPALAFAVSLAAILASLAFAWPKAGGTRKAILSILAGVSATFLVMNDRIGLLEVQMVKSYEQRGVQRMEPTKVFEKWSPVSRVAVFRPTVDWRGEHMHVTNDAGAPTALIRFDGDLSKIQTVLRDPQQIAYHLRPQAESLIIGAGGGIDLLAGLKFGNRKITAVEINPVIAELTTSIYADYIGRIFHDPRVEFHLQEGRNFAAGSKDTYDVVKITMIDSWAGAAAGAYLFNENTLYTFEAIRDYYTHLKDDGILSITRYYTWDEIARILNTYLEYLDSVGTTSAQNRVILLREEVRGAAYRRATVLLKRGEFTPAEVAKVVEQEKLGHFRIVYAPGLAEGDLFQTPYADYLRSLIRGPAASRRQLIAAFPRDIAPSRDDRPFFFFMDRFSSVFRPNYNDHPARRLALPLLYGSFILLAILAILTIIAPLWLSKDVTIREAPHRTRLLLYFAGIGIGFMLIEISLIHRLTVFLGQPAYSFVVVLTSLLFASGVGSLSASYWSPSPSPRKLSLVLGGIVALVLLLVFFVYDKFIDLMWLEMPARIGLSVLVLLPTGFLLGMCFPMGMQIARRFHEHFVPWGWGVNGAFSVFASACSLVIALNFGLKTMMMAGALCYAVNLILVQALRREADAGTLDSAPAETGTRGSEIAAPGVGG